MWPWKTKADLHDSHAKYASVFTGPVGEEALQEIAAYAEAFTGHRPRDPYQQAFIEGKRAVFWHIWEYTHFGADELFRFKVRRLEEPTNG